MGTAESGLVRRHAVKDEPVQAFVRPGVVRVQPFQDEQWCAGLDRQLDGALQREIEAGAARGDHPVEDEIAARVERARVERADSRIRNR